MGFFFWGMIVIIFKKTILLDIDGVLSPFGCISDDFTSIDLDGWATLSIPNDTLNLIRIMKRHNLIWVSTWEELSNNILKELNLSNSKHLSFNNSLHSNDWIKEYELIKYVTKNKRKKILLIDDEIPDNSILYSFKNLTIIKPNDLTGLSKNEKLFIYNYLNETPL